MLSYDHEGLLEVEGQAIKQLCRSRAALIVGDPDRDTFEIHAVLCKFLDDEIEHCLAAFHARTLKRALVYEVAGDGGPSAWQIGREVLIQLGFQLEDVNLKLSPAMLEVVLRDIPGLAAPGEAHRQRQERAMTVAELQNTHYRRPDSDAGTRASNKLKAEQRMEDRSRELRKVLDAMLAPAEAAAADQKAHLDEIKKLRDRLSAAEAIAESERQEKGFAEAITAAAEKRIQELEISLVEMETISAESQKQRRKLAKLQKQVRELSAALEIAGQEKNAAEQQIVALEEELQEQGELADRLDDAMTMQEGLQSNLAEAQQALQEALEHQDERETALAKAVEKGAVLAGELKEAQNLAAGMAHLEDQLAALTEQETRLTSEVMELREKYSQECTLRKHLETAAAENEKRLGELKKSLARALEDAAERARTDKNSSDIAAEGAAFEVERQEQVELLAREKKAVEALEATLQATREQITTLEDKLGQSEQTAAEASSLQAELARERSGTNELKAKLQEAEDQLASERAVQEKLAISLAAAERRLAEPAMRGEQLNAAANPGQTPEAGSGKGMKSSGRSKSSRPLPHELRPAPKKGAFFHPDWDLSGLPCDSADQICSAWESAFNVQTSPEGYPFQYCMAYLVVLDHGEEKRLYLLYRLKKSKHNLVSVPAMAPCDEASLQKTIAEGLSFLKKSGFEMEEIAPDRVAGSLGSYFLNTR